MRESRVAPSGAKKLVDFTDPAARDEWLRAARRAFKDLDAVTADALRPKRERDLGVREQLRLHGDSRATLISLFARALGPDEGEDDDGGESPPL